MSSCWRLYSSSFHLLARNWIRLIAVFHCSASRMRSSFAAMQTSFVSLLLHIAGAGHVTGLHEFRSASTGT